MDFEHSFDRLLNEYLKSRYPNRVRDSLIETLAQEAKSSRQKRCNRGIKTHGGRGGSLWENELS